MRSRLHHRRVQPPSGSRRDRVPGPRGFTLLELMLVLGIVAAIAAMAWPSFHTALLSRRLTGEAEEVRNRLRDARREALRSGLAYRFDVDPATGDFRVVPDSTPLREDSATTEAAPLEEVEEKDKPEPVMAEGSLLTGHRFVLGAKFTSFLAGDADSEEPKPESAAKPSSEDAAASESPAGAPKAAKAVNADGEPVAGGTSANWRTVAKFFPDGSAEGKPFALADAEGKYVELRLRKLTGEVAVSGLNDPPETAEDAAKKMGDEAGAKEAELDAEGGSR